MVEDRSKVNKAIRLVAQLSVDKSSQLLSKLLKVGAKIELENVYITDISEISGRVAREDDEVVGALVDLVGDAPFKFLFYVKLPESFLLADMMLRRPSGTTKAFDVYASSAVQEIGNILASAIANVFSTGFQIAMKPTPPVVVRDYAGTIFEEYLIGVAAEKNDVLIVETKFHIIKNDIQCHMFILPLADSEKILSGVADTL